MKLPFQAKTIEYSSKQAGALECMLSKATHFHLASSFLVTFLNCVSHVRMKVTPNPELC